MSRAYRPPLTPKEKALLDQLSRATDPTEEERARLDYELETRPLARAAFVAEVTRLRALRDLCHRHKARLPAAVREQLEAACPKTKGFDHLVALADAKDEPHPEVDLIA